MDAAEHLEAILLETDPVKRVGLATEANGLTTVEFSTIVADALAEMSEGARYAVATSLFESEAAGRLVAAVADQCAGVYALVADQQPNTRSLSREENIVAERISATIKERPEYDQPRCQNLLNNLFGAGRLTTRSAVEELVSQWSKAWESIGDES